MFSKLARILVVPAVVAALGIPAIAASASPTHPSANSAKASNPGGDGSPPFYWIGYGDDGGDGTGHPGEQTSADFYVQPETVADDGSHSLTQYWVQDQRGDTVEFGVETNPQMYGTTNQVLFADTWTAGTWDGLIGSTTYEGPIFHSTSSIKFDSPSTPLADDQWDLFGVNFTDNQVQFWLNGSELGYIPGGDWPGTWTGNQYVAAWGEAYEGTTDTLPTMDGGVKNYYSASGLGLKFNSFGDQSVYPPYEIHSTSSTGFTFSGPS